jgi:hypothetical protein
MTDTANPTAGNSGASNPDPIDRLEAYLAASDGDTGAQEPQGGNTPKEPAAQAAKTPDKPSEGATGEDTEPQITTSQLAKVLGVDESLIDVDADGAPVFKTKIDGKESAAKFQDFLKTHQLQGHAENRVREAAEKEKAAERKMQEADQATQAKLQEQQASLQQLHQMNAILQEELRGEYQSINWDALWQQDPAQARALERRFDARQQRINGVFQTIQMRNAQAQQQAEQMRKANEEKSKAAQAERLFSLIPEWKDSATFQKERDEIIGWLNKTGFDASEFDLNKATHVSALRQLWQHATLQAAKPEIEKKVREAPKLVKPGAAQQADTSNSAVLKDLKSKVKESGGKSTQALTQLLLAKGLA